MAVRRLNALPAPGPDLAQDLTDAMFRHFDIAFREMGVSDTTVPKRMKKFASSWLGRARSYGGALDAKDSDALAQALSRNVYGMVEVVPSAIRLSHYIEAVGARWSEVSLDVFLNGTLPAVAPETIT